MLIKVSELQGSALDWAVAKCEGGWVVEGPIHELPGYPTFSIDWCSGGPIIEREGITVSHTAHGFWEAYKRPTTPRDYYESSDLPLIAAMRCYVASKVGDTIEIPDELLD